MYVYRSSSFINSTAVLDLSLLHAAGKVGKGLSSLGLSLACLAAQIIVCPSLASWTLCAFKLSVWKLFVWVRKNNACFFHLETPCKCAKHFVFVFIKVEPLVLFFPRFLKLPCFLDRSCGRHCRCRVTLVILLSSEESIQWALNLFSFGRLSKLNFERKYRGHQVLELWKHGREAHHIPTMQFISE